MPEVVMVIAPAQFRDEEYSKPRSVLEAHGAHVVTASSSPGKCIGKLGMVAEADIALADAVGRPWDATVFVGGGGAKVFFDDQDAHSLAREALEAGHVLAAICIAPSVLARAGLLRDVRATAFPSQRDDLVRHGARWDAGPVVVEDRIITANGPEAAEQFGERITDLLGI